MTRKFNCFNQVSSSALIEAETRIGHHLSPSQRLFVILMSKKNGLVALGKKRKRTSAEEALLRTLQVKIKNAKRDMKDFDQRLLINPKSKSGAERESSRKKGRDQEQVETEKAVQRVSMVAKRAGRTPEQVEKEKAVQRVSKVAKRAGVI